MAINILAVNTGYSGVKWVDDQNNRRVFPSTVEENEWVGTGGQLSENQRVEMVITLDGKTYAVGRELKG